MVRRGTTLVVDGSLFFVVVVGGWGARGKGLNNLGTVENSEVSLVLGPWFRAVLAL